MLMIFPIKYLLSIQLNLYTDDIIIIVFQMVKLLGPSIINEDKKSTYFVIVLMYINEYQILSCIFNITSALRIIILLSKVQWV